MAISDDPSWARRLIPRDAQDEEAWRALLLLVDELAHQSVRGGSRFSAEDVASLALERIVRYRERDLAAVVLGPMTMRAVMARLVRNSVYDLATSHARACRSASGTMADMGTEADGDAVLTEHLAAVESDEPRLRLWSGLLATDAIVAYQHALALIHEAGPTWRGAAPYYPLLLVDERLFWSRQLTVWSSRGLVGGIPPNAAAVIVPWSSSVGALPLRNGTVDSVVAQGPFAQDHQLAGVLGVAVNTLQQWRSRARAKVAAGHDSGWVRHHLPHWPDPEAVTSPRVERKDQV